MTKATRITRQEAGELIFDAWGSANGEGMSKAETMAEANLTSKQFENGKQYLREILIASQADPLPFSYDPRTDRYYLNLYAEPVEEYYRMRLAITAKQLRYLLSGSGVPAHKKFGDRLWGRMTRNTARVLEDIDDLIDVLG